MFWDIIKSILYGIVEGITEWLPISSTGHLILLEELLPFKNAGPAFFEMYEVVIQLGAIIAVLLLFFKKLWPFQNNAAQLGIKRYVKADSINLWLKVLIASLPAAIIGLPLDDFLDTYLYNKTTVSITLILYGILFIVVERYNKNRTARIDSTGEITYTTAALIGCFQVLAMIPGTSRSGATILGAILIGLSRPAAAEFSFFLAIPTMVGASGLKLVKFLMESSFTTEQIAILLVGMIVSFVVSVIAIRGLMSYVKKKDFSFFGYYRIILGIIVLAFVIFA